MFQFDHFIHYVESPEQAMEELKKCGLHAVMGGRHENHGTYNSLCYFDLSYIELLGTFDKALMTEKADPYSLRETILQSNFTEGGQRTALRTTNIAETAAHFERLGYDIFGPVDFSRKRPDGSLVIWKLLFVGKKDEAPILPFFIEWAEADASRYADLAKRETIAPHHIGKVKLKQVGYLVEDLEKVVDAWKSALRLEVSDVYQDDRLQAKTQSLYLQGGDITFYQPIGRGKAKEYLDKNGQKPFLIVLENDERNEDIEINGVIYRFIKK